ncbi:MAG: DEAD/DEAH box helicase, partial [Firmicutes bacterium]|nr:DEAD/DEAH box helicase [Bacillota bacterium]
QRYGLRKFIIVVPSVAIREGVLKNLRITEEHFRQVYQNPTYRYYVYDSASLAQVRQFALSDGLEIMVMTLASFNRAANVIRQSTDRLQGETPLHLVQATRPVLILDEPQNMESELSKDALASLNPLLALRYSATHRYLYNLVYRLTPFEAYRQGLVKRIEVAGVEEVDSANVPFIRLDGIRTEKNTVRARLTVHRLFKGGDVRESQVTVGPGENLEAKTNRPEYAAYVVDEINPGGGFIRFSNGTELTVGEATGMDYRSLWEGQIRYAIEEHFIKQRRLLSQGIKVLSLFFIDRVDNYTRDDAPIRCLFDECFREVAAAYPDVCEAVWGERKIEPETVRAAYFASRRTRAGEVIYEDSSTGEAEKDREVYDLIMRDKERLLSLGEPVAFIFSHSALREGWDNPNVFQICTLNQTASEMKKRQEIGRGVRLAVNQVGERIHSEQVNLLTVVANESYQDYVARLQTEYAEEYAEQERPPQPPNARKRRTARLRKCYLLSEEFKGLWERIKHKTRYAVKIDSGRLIGEAVDELDRATIQPPRITVTKAQVQVSEDDALAAMQVSGAKTLLEITGRHPLPNLVWLIEELLERTTPPVRISRRTILEICRRTNRKQAAVDNPHEFARVAAQIIKAKLRRQLVDGIRYEKIGEWYEMTQFEGEIEGWEEYLIPAKRCLYDHVVIDPSEVERRFVEGLESREDVKLYVKLPAWFTVATPIGDYNPDWAIVIEPRDEHGQPTGEGRLYLVRETKDTTDVSRLRPDEADKIRCGERHFRDALGVDYAVVTSAGEV